MGVLSGRVERRFGPTFPEPPVPPAGSAFGPRQASFNPSRSDSALQKVAVWSSVNLLGQIATMIPVDFYTGVDLKKRQVDPPKWIFDPEGNGYGLEDFIYQLIYCWGLRGNVYADTMHRDDVRGQADQVLLQHPDNVSFRLVDGQAEWRFGADVIPNKNVIHRRAFPTPGRDRIGLSPIALHALTIGQGLSAARFGQQWFDDGAHPSSVYTNDTLGDISQETAATLKARIIAAIRGTREPLVLTGGWKYQAVSVAASESQFLETQRYTASECARIYGPGMPEMLGYDTGTSMTYANVEQRSLDLLTYTVNPWLVRVERFLTSLLPPDVYAKFNRNALLQTDVMTRWNVYKIALETQSKVVNEVRLLEDMEPVPWGDKPVPILKNKPEAVQPTEPDSAQPAPAGLPLPAV